MGVAFEPFRGDYDCDLLFVNCGTSDRFEANALRTFVEQGGCLYASDLTSDLMQSTFPGMFDFDARGSAGLVEACVVDEELQEIAGTRTNVYFDMPGWAVLRSFQGDTLVKAADGTAHPGRPLMVGARVGNGAVFYTSFHNRAQASAQETVLLQLLVLKQMGTATKSSLAEASRSTTVNLNSLKAQVRSTP